MTGNTVKECRNCHFEVEPQHTGPCPQCGKQAGYNITVSINEVVNVTDVVKTYKKSMHDALRDVSKKYSELTKKYEKDEKILKRIEKFQKNLEDLKEELIDKAEENARKDATKTFTMDAVIGSEEQRKQYFENNIKSKIKADGEKTTRELIEDMLLNQNITSEKIEKIHDRLSPKQTILFGLVIGIFGSIIGGLIVVAMSGLVMDFPANSSDLIPIMNGTNSTRP